jgi:hypothetical protein
VWEDKRGDLPTQKDLQKTGSLWGRTIYLRQPSVAVGVHLGQLGLTEEPSGPSDAVIVLVVTAEVFNGEDDALSTTRW